MMILSILIPTLPGRKEQFEGLLHHLYSQCAGRSDIEILADNRGKPVSIGEKRNYLLDAAGGKYVCFFDDDDMPSADYIKTLLEGIKTDPDCISLRGMITVNGADPQVFEHSIMYDAYKTTDNYIKYERYPNHLNCIRARIAKQFRFPEINHGEDTDWATQIYKSGLLKTEFYTENIIYYYNYISDK